MTWRRKGDKPNAADIGSVALGSPQRRNRWDFANADAHTDDNRTGRAERSGSKFNGNLTVATNEPVDIAAIFREGTLIDRAMNLAVRDAIQLHKEKGVPLVVWREGKIMFIAPEEAERTWIEANPELAVAYPKL